MSDKKLSRYDKQLMHACDLMIEINRDDLSCYSYSILKKSKFFVDKVKYSGQEILTLLIDNMGKEKFVLERGGKNGQYLFLKVKERHFL